jgi:hypothetical protein
MTRRIFQRRVNETYGGNLAELTQALYEAKGKASQCLERGFHPRSPETQLQQLLQ